MLHQVKIRIKTPVIGNRWSAGRRLYEFTHNGGEWEMTSQEKETWNGYVRNALASLGLHLDHRSFRWPRCIPLPTLYLHQVPKKKGGFASHEAISKNTVITFFLQIREFDGAQHLASPDAAQLYEIFKFIGAYEGISPFAPERGFGLFDVISVDVCGRSVHGDLTPTLLVGGEPDVQGQEPGTG